MMRIRKAFWIALLAAMLFPGVAYAKSPINSVVVGGTFTLSAGETYDSDLVTIGGKITLEEGSTVLGNVVMVGGSLEAAGKVNGDVASIGGSIHLAATADIGGDVACIGSEPNIEKGAKVAGTVRSVSNMAVPINIPDIENLPATPQPTTPGGLSVFLDVNPFYEVTAFLFRILVISALAVLVVMFLPLPTERVSRVVVSQPALAFLVGILTMVAAFALFLVLVLTICLSPIGLLGILVLVAAILFGWIGIGLEVGNRLATLFRQQLHPAAAAGVGTMMLTVVANGVWYFPCFGGILVLLALSFGLGAVVLTRFGGREYLATRGQTAPPAA